MKSFLFFLFLAISVYSQDISHYRIYADLQKDPIFKELLAEANLEDVFLTRYQIVVNTEPRETAFIVIGSFESPDVEYDIDAYRYDWLFLSKNLRERLSKYPRRIIIK